MEFTLPWIKQGQKTENWSTWIKQNSKEPKERLFQVNIPNMYSIRWWLGPDTEIRKSSATLTTTVCAEWWSQCLPEEDRENGKRGIRESKYEQLFQGVSFWKGEWRNRVVPRGRSGVRRAFFKRWTKLEHTCLLMEIFLTEKKHASLGQRENF